MISSRIEGLSRRYAGATLVTGLALVWAGCSPTATESAERTIGAEGGSVAITQGTARGASVTVTAGALTRGVVITAREGQRATSLPSSMQPVGPVVVFGPEGQTFGAPVTITLPTTSAATVMYTRPLGGSTWTVVPGARYDAARGVIVGRVQHFSEFVPASDPTCTPSPEVCNHVDDDCNGTIDDGDVCGSTCAASTVDCDGNPSNGCEIDVLSDAANCGACGVSCRPGDVCTAGVCMPRGGSCTPSPEVCNGVDDDCDGTIDNGLSCPGACTASTVDCDRNPANGCEVDLLSDAANCGACGSYCAPGDVCSWGVCMPRGGSCTPSPEVCNGLDDDCNGLTDDGLGTLSCGVGACGATTPACVGGVAVACRPGTPAPEVCNHVDDDCDGTIDNGGVCGSTCAASTVDCDRDPSNGCEIDVLSDAANCGACGRSCRPGDVCTAGVCMPRGGSCTPSPEVCNHVDDDCDGFIDNGLSCPGACGAGRVDCDGNPTNGCEIDTQSDAANCGACGTACRPGATCTAGACR